VKLYKAYLFRGQDPVVRELRTILIDRYGVQFKKELGGIDRAGGPTRGTLNNWFSGKTRCPQNATIEAAGRALGMKRVWVKSNGKKTNGDKDEE